MPSSSYGTAADHREKEARPTRPPKYTRQPRGRVTRVVPCWDAGGSGGGPGPSTCGCPMARFTPNRGSPQTAVRPTAAALSRGRGVNRTSPKTARGRAAANEAQPLRIPPAPQRDPHSLVTPPRRGSYSPPGRPPLGYSRSPPPPLPRIYGVRKGADRRLRGGPGRGGRPGCWPRCWRGGGGARHGGVGPFPPPLRPLPAPPGPVGPRRSPASGAAGRRGRRRQGGGAAAAAAGRRAATTCRRRPAGKRCRAGDGAAGAGAAGSAAAGRRSGPGLGRRGGRRRRRRGGGRRAVPGPWRGGEKRVGGTSGTRRALSPPAAGVNTCPGRGTSHHRAEGDTTEPGGHRQVPETPEGGQDAPFLPHDFVGDGQEPSAERERRRRLSSGGPPGDVARGLGDILGGGGAGFGPPPK